ncbi:organomercurial lyase MerB [Candidatus Manganitrophus noduliformans]|uniref:Alkylmercury lyase n=1 Tax=Candidatus Manganitrophus noduliformans TaxID=2606439 RepID=A0A7X6DNM9_9BACT|nr:organomercurial lyase MerB [Candidatus Manganitrophus noduliformans]NKE70233.1 organomercurial lyase MerB [Candidatus Manganitrophus noduliformans]
MQSLNLSEIATTLKEGLRESLFPDKIGLFHPLLRLLAKGSPVALGQIAATLHLFPSDVAAALGMLRNVEFDQDGNIVGAGITLNPTRHRFEVNGRKLFTWCAMDTLIFPMILNQTARVASTCPATGITVRLTVTPGGVEHLEPADAVVSLPKLSETCCDVRANFCNQVHFFSSSDAASAWLSERPGATLLSIQEAWRIGSILVSSLFRSDLEIGGTLECC